jgi:peptide/nickel transport system substrate-binding protein
VTDNQPSRELRLKGGSSLLGYIKKFSSTEKAIFGVFALAALTTAIIMAGEVNSHFMVEIPAKGGTLREGLVGLPHTVNPILAVTDVDRDISSLVYAGLTKYEDGDIVPDMASDWNVSADGLTYAFNLRPGLKFQDGTPVTADDVVFTVGKAQDPTLKSPRAGDWAGVTATAVSPTQARFVLKQPYGAFLSATTLGIIPKHVWSVVSDDQFIFSEYNTAAIGSGPYKISSQSRDRGGIPTGYRLTTWTGYYGAAPDLSTIAFSFFPDQDHALSALLDGGIDSLSAVMPEEAAHLASNTGESYRVISSPLSRVFGVFWNRSQNPALADLSVRQALSMTVDRNALVSTVLDGYGVPAFGPLPPGLDATSSPVDPPDIAAARTLLEKAGWKRGSDGIYAKKIGKAASTTLSFTLYTADAPELKQSADALKASWTALGASVSVKAYDSSDLYQNVIRPRKYDALLFGEQIGRDGDVYAFWHSSERNPPGLNVAMYANSKADKLLESIRAATSSGARATLYSQLDQIVSADSPAVFLYAPDFIYAVPKSLHGVSLDNMTVPADRFNSIADWYITTDKVWSIFAK